MRTFQIGFVLNLVWVFPLFMLINTGEWSNIMLGVLPLTIGLGLTYGPQSAMFAEIFPARVRYSGAGLAYAIGAILGGAFSPLISTFLYGKFGTSTAISIYLFTFTAIGLIAVSTIKDRTGLPLGKEANDIPGNAQLEAAVAAQKVSGTPATFEHGAGY